MGQGLGAGWTIAVFAVTTVGALVLWRLNQIGWHPVAGLFFVLLYLIFAAIRIRIRS